MARKSIAAALKHANGLSLGWWRDERHEGDLRGVGSEANRRLAYGRAQGAATAIKAICESLGIPLPEGWTDMPPELPPR